MRRNIVKVLALSTIIVLASCGRDDKVSGNIYYGNSFKDTRGMVLSYNIDKVLSHGSRISGTLLKQENAELKTSYYLAYTPYNPASPYENDETVIMTWTDTMFESNTEVKYDIELDIEKVFVDTKKDDTVFFLIYSDNFKAGDLTTFAYTEFRYRWVNDKVKLILEY